MSAADLEPTTHPLAAAHASVRIATRALLVLVVGPLLVALGAALRIDTPFGVPITLQTLVVLGSGALLGAALGPLSIAAYLVYGMLGLPLFASGAGHGFDYLLGPTGGYLLAMPVAACLAGKAHARLSAPEDAMERFLALFACGVLILLAGALYRVEMRFSTWAAELPIAIFFLPVEAAKAALLTPTLAAARRRSDAR